MSEDLLTTSKLIIKDFNLEESDLPSVKAVEDLRAALLKIVSYLLNNDFEKFILAMYRIDISETKVKTILATSDPENIASELTDLIIERELQKVETRKKYSSN
ncbi:hypothetical protein [Fulvivirga lutea]|uniref:Uncharacterized protein n=1 Tax=Fulvivirga lutea TaxID=2810512 RepID=A0A975A1M3_9BACT|nr:hypothetical protein [Fulvivirga lutea]QSE97677.1 hypothetical protein JR347_00905 [Fulvivirga lutea]